MHLEATAGEAKLLTARQTLVLSRKSPSLHLPSVLYLFEQHETNNKRIKVCPALQQGVARKLRTSIFYIINAICMSLFIATH